MRLVFVLDSLGSGGAQRQVVELACFLHAKRDVAVEILIYHDIDFFAPRLREAGIPLTVLPKRRKVDLGFVLRLRRWLAERRPDVVHAFLLAPALWTLLAVRGLPRGRRPRFIAGERSAEIAARPLLERLQRFVYRRSDAVSANAASVAWEISAKLDVAKDRVHHLPNGIDFDAWDRLAARPCPIVLAPGRLHLALVGGLRAEKNHLVLLDALAALEPSRRAALEVLFVGAESGSPGDAGRVHEGIVQRGLESVVRVVPSTAEIAALIARLDAIVMPSAFEGFPNVLLEAMASGVPAIASAVGAIPELLTEGETGFLVPPGDTDALVAALVAFQDLSHETRRALGQRARTAVRARYGIEVVADRYLALYRQLADGAGTRSGA